MSGQQNENAHRPVPDMLVLHTTQAAVVKMSQRSWGMQAGEKAFSAKTDGKLSFSEDKLKTKNIS